MRKSIFGVLIFLVVSGLAVALICEKSLAAGGKGNVEQLGEQVYVWHFDEGSGDETVDATADLVGTFEGDIEWVEGISGTALAFSGAVGSAQYVEVLHSDEVDIDEQLTMAAWVYPDPLPTGGQENKATVMFKLSYYMQLEPGDGKDSTISYYFYETAPPGYHMSDGTIKAEEWTHIAVVWDGDEATFYINGEEAGSVNQAGIGKSSADSLKFGGENADCCPRFFQGRLDEVMVANYAFSKAEIGELVAALAVEPRNSLSITWGEIKRAR